MKALRQFGIILGILLLSHMIQILFNLPIPAAVLGMFILLIFLLTGVVKLEMIADVSDFLLDHLTFIFIPAGVSVMTQFDLISGNWLSILFIVLLSTFMVIAVTGLVTQGLLKIKKTRAKGGINR